MATKNLDYYLGLDYDVSVIRLEAGGEVVYKAFSRDLDPYVFYGQGATKQEALESFEETKNDLMRVYIEEGRLIQEPTREDESLPSGKFVLRIDPQVHWKLVNLAKKAKKSLNSYVDQVLVAHVTGEDIAAKVCSTVNNLKNDFYRKGDLSVQKTEKIPPEYSDYSTNEKLGKRVA